MNFKPALAYPRTTLCKKACRSKHGQRGRGESPMAKYSFTRAASEVVKDAMRQRSGLSAIGHHRAACFYRDLGVERISSGTDQERPLTNTWAATKEYHLVQNPPLAAGGVRG